MNDRLVQDLRDRMTALMRDDTEEHRALRMRILDVAADHFARFGFRKANIGEIARDVGIGKGSLYLHFESKQVLLIAAITRDKMAVMAPFQALMELPPTERLRPYLELSLRFVLTSPLTARLMRGDPEITRIAREYSDEHPDEVEAGLSIIDGLIRARLPDADDRQIRNRSIALRAILTAAAHIDLSSLAGLSTEDFITTTASLFVDGVRP